MKVSISRTVYESEANCVGPGSKDTVDPVLIFGLGSNYGYNKDSCQLVSKQELLARELLFCTFNLGGNP